MKHKFRKSPLSFGVLCTLFLLYACTPKTSGDLGKTPAPAPSKEVVEVGTAPAQRPTWTGGAIPKDESVRIGTLPNGMKYYIRQNAKPEKRVEFRLAVAAGSTLEDKDQLGLAHFVEHMAFNGTKNFKKSELVDYLESVGTKFGPDLNAFTSFDETVYMLQTRTDDRAILDKGLLVMQDWASGLLFDGEEIDKERGVVISEWRTGLGAEQRMQQKYLPIILKNSRYSERLPIGDPEILKHAAHDALRRFYKDWYRPDLMAVVVVGDVNVDEMEREIKTRFGSIEKAKSPRKKETYSIPGHKETLVSICSDKEASNSVVQLMYKHKYTAPNNIDDYRNTIVQRVYNDILNARLREITQQPNPPFTFAFTGYEQTVGDMATYSSFALAPEGGIKKALEVIAEENERVMRHGFTQTELDRQKTQILRFAESAVKEKDKTESQGLAMSYVYNFLQNSPIPSPEQELELLNKLLPTILLPELNGLAKLWISKENRVVVATGPEKAEAPMPTEAEVLGILDAVGKKDVKPYEDKTNEEPLMNGTPPATKPVSEVKNEKLGYTVMTLANGATVYLKQTDFKNDEVLLSAFSEGGHSLYPATEYASARFAAQVVDEAGLGKFDGPQLEKKLTGKIVGMTPYISETSEGFNGSASPQDLETMFQMLYLYCTMPYRSKDAINIFSTKQKAFFKNMLSNPQSWFSNEGIKIKYDNHPRRGFPTSEDFDKIKFEDVYATYQDRFVDAGSFTYFIVGNFEMEKMKKLVNSYIGNLPNPKRNETWKDINAGFVQGTINQTFNKGEAPKSIVDITYHGDFDWDDLQARHNFTSMVSVLEIKLRESMREDKGGVYGVRVFGSVSRIPKEGYSFNINFNCDPGKERELIDAAMKDIDNAMKMGAEEKDLVKVKETQKQERIKSLKENRYWLGALQSSVTNGLNPEVIIPLEEFEKRIAAFNSDAMKAMANKCFNTKNRIELILQPEKK